MKKVVLAAVIASSAVACSGGVGENAQSDSEKLYEGSGVQQWVGGIVPVCYSSTDGNNSTLLANAQTILNNYGWPTVANVQFTGWGQCGSTAVSAPGQTGGQVRLHFKAGSNGSTAIEGQTYKGFNDVYLVSDDTVGNHFQYEVLHEFGHVLGWDHEQQRPDNWPNGPTGSEQYCKSNQAGQGDDTGGTTETSYFDTQSIMSYCTGWPQQLSPGDVAGVQKAYGPLTSISRGQNSSNNTASRTANNLDSFFVHSDGSVWTNYWYAGMAGGYWPTFQLPGAGPGSAPNNAPIAAVSRASVNLDIFYVGNDGAIHSSYWSAAGGWGSLSLAGTTGLAKPGSQIAAVSGSPGQIDVFFAGTDGNLYWDHWSGQCSGSNTLCGWSSAPIKVVADKSIPVGAAVTAVARTPDRLDVFYIESDGAPHTSACFGFGTTGSGSCTAGNFVNFKLATASACLAPTGGGIAATARTATNIDIFYTNNTSGICTHYWSQAAGWNDFQLAASVELSGGQIAAVTRSPNNLDIFWMGTNAQGTGDIHSAWWSASAGGWGTADIASTYGGVGIPGGTIGAAARTSNNLDTFTQGILLFGGNTESQTTAYWYTGAKSWTAYENDAY